MNDLSLKTLQSISTKVYNLALKMNSLSDKENPFFPESENIGFLYLSLHSSSITLYPKTDKLNEDILSLLLPYIKKQEMYIGVTDKKTIYLSFNKP